VAFQDFRNAFKNFQNDNRRNKNATSALGTPRTQATYYTIVIGSGVGIGVVLMVLFTVIIGGSIKTRSQQTALENQGAEVAPVELFYEKDTAGATNYDVGNVVQVEKWEKAAAQGDQKAQAELRAALSRGQANYNRICIGCHFGPPNAVSNGPWLGNLYQTGYLYNGRKLNDANVVTFILLGSQSHNIAEDGKRALVNGGGGFNPMPAGIATPQQAVDIMLYLKQQTSKKS